MEGWLSVDRNAWNRLTCVIGIAGALLLHRLKDEGLIDIKTRRQVSVVVNSYTCLRLVTIWKYNGTKLITSNIGDDPIWGKSVVNKQYRIGLTKVRLSEYKFISTQLRAQSGKAE